MNIQHHIIVSGSQGQLGQEFKKLAGHDKDLKFVFYNKEEWDVTDSKKSDEIFRRHKPIAFINCAAYTQVDQAESDQKLCFTINRDSLVHLSEVCQKYDCLMIHYSTDYVFDGSQTKPYLEKDKTNPLNIYGKSKKEGEEIIEKSNCPYLIIRTSWLYSQFGQNFVKTMIKLGSSRDEISVIDDQIASPTNAYFLALESIDLIKEHIDSPIKSDIRHFTHSGTCSWNDFAKEIFHQKNITCAVKGISTEAYNSEARRPKYSKIWTNNEEKTSSYMKLSWQEALSHCLNALEKNGKND